MIQDSLGVSWIKQLLKLSVHYGQIKSTFYKDSKLSFDANVSSFSLAESPPSDLQITAYK